MLRLRSMACMTVPSREPVPQAVVLTVVLISLVPYLLTAAPQIIAPTDSSPTEPQAGWVTVRPADTGAALENPGMGWVFHHYDNGITGYGPPLGEAYDGRAFPGLTVAYLRLAWSLVEPVEGAFNWSILDTPIQRYGAAGKEFAFRFTVFEGDPKQGTPDWVRAAGAKEMMVEAFGVKSWEPECQRG
jgi:hypothetical protein